MKGRFEVLVLGLAKQLRHQVSAEQDMSLVSGGDTLILIQSGKLKLLNGFDHTPLPFSALQPGSTLKVGSSCLILAQGSQLLIYQWTGNGWDLKSVELEMAIRDIAYAGQGHWAFVLTLANQLFHVQWTSDLKLTSLEIGIENMTNVYISTRAHAYPDPSATAPPCSILIQTTHPSHLQEWGTNQFGQLSHTSLSIRNPVLIDVLEPMRILQVSIGHFHTLVLCEMDGLKSVYSCGWNRFGQLGRGSETAPNKEFQLIDLPEEDDDDEIVQVCAGGQHSLVRMKSGRVFSCGWDKYNQCSGSSESKIFSSDEPDHVQKEWKLLSAECVSMSASDTISALIRRVSEDE